MAVVQISRIQQRRGRKLAGTGFPQLASGEIGWAIDTQELYIGNGSVSEGAPYVGNTQILTEHVNILDFAEAYRYRKNNPSGGFPEIQTGPTATTPVERTLQQRFDERVSLSAFISQDELEETGDYTRALQRAIDQLYLNSTKANETTRVVIYIEPGVYEVSDEIRIPPYVHLVGSGTESTVIRQTANKPLFRMVDGNSSSGNYTPFASMNHLQRPRYIHIEGLSLETESAQPIVLLDNTDFTVFDRVKFFGTFDFNDGSVIPGQTAIRARSASESFRPQNVQFRSCIFSNTGYGFFSDGDHDNISFVDCIFYQLFEGVTAGDRNKSQQGAVNTKIIGCHFDFIVQHGIWIKKGKGNSSIGNKFIRVGNEAEGDGAPVYPIIQYDDENNFSTDDYFERNFVLKRNGLDIFLPNVKSPGRVDDKTSFIQPIGENLILVPLEIYRFPITEPATFVIDYVINKDIISDIPLRVGTVRTGKIHITVNPNPTNLQHHIEDNYTYTGDSSVENIVFSVTLEDFNGDTEFETLVLNIFNPPGNGTGTMNYTYYTMNSNFINN